MLTCQDYRGIYIGETSWQLDVSIEKYSCAQKKSPIGLSALANHIIKTGHSFKRENAVLLQKKNSDLKWIILENTNIVHRNNRMHECVWGALIWASWCPDICAAQKHPCMRLRCMEAVPMGIRATLTEFMNFYFC